jgi:hypothetical protein
MMFSASMSPRPASRTNPRSSCLPRLRWGIDYDFGAASDLIPSELVIPMKPALGETTSADRYTELSSQVARADALLASGDLTTSDHKYLVEQILATYNATL